MAKGRTAPVDDQPEPEPVAIETLIEQAESLLRPPTAGYSSADESFNRGVEAVLRLLRAAL
jgi:hypothetical protein